MVVPATAVDALCVEPVTGCEELTAGCKEIADVNKLSIALATKKGSIVAHTGALSASRARCILQLKARIFKHSLKQ